MAEGSLNLQQRIHVVAAVVSDDEGRILIARRPQHLHQGGLWEFPGGKVEPGETREAALIRELNEEVGIGAKAFRPLIQVAYNFPDRKVLLDVWRVNRFSGCASGIEGQEVRWVDTAALGQYAFPEANRPILRAVSLPDRYLITPEPPKESNWPEFITSLERALDSGIRLLQFRSKQLNDEEHRELASRVLALCRAKSCTALLNGSPELARELGYDGVHLSSAALRQAPFLDGSMLVAASCHNAEELMLASRLGCDFAVLGAVKPTASHPEGGSLGWAMFESLAEQSDIPLYALGGMTLDDMAQAWRHGAQGIAAIRALWVGE